MLVPDCIVLFIALQSYSVVCRTYLAPISGSMQKPIEGGSLPRNRAFGAVQLPPKKPKEGAFVLAQNQPISMLKTPLFIGEGEVAESKLRAG
jgi:hypothetical protein